MGQKTFQVKEMVLNCLDSSPKDVPSRCTLPYQCHLNLGASKPGHTLLALGSKLVTG